MTINRALVTAALALLVAVWLAAFLLPAPGQDAAAYHDERSVDQVAMSRCVTAGGKATMSENNEFISCVFWRDTRP